MKLQGTIKSSKKVKKSVVGVPDVSFINLFEGIASDKESIKMFEGIATSGEALLRLSSDSAKVKDI